MSKKRILILGLGNELIGDDGVGVHAVRKLETLGFGQDVIILDIGTAILDALPYLYEAEQLIIIDAMKDGGGVPGTIYKTDLEGCISNGCIASMHGFDISRVMALAGRSRSLPGVVFGIEPELLNWSMNLSSPVAEVLPHLVKAVVAELRIFGLVKIKAQPRLSEERG